MNDKADDPESAGRSQTSCLNWWRTLTPDLLRARRDDLAVELVALSRGLVPEEILARAALAQREAGLQAVEALPSGDGELRGSWLAWSAAHSDRLATLMLVRELERRTEMLRRSYRGERVSSADDITRIQKLILAWLTMLSLPDLATSLGRQQFARMLEEYTAPTEQEQEIDLVVDFEDTPEPATVDVLPPRIPDTQMLRVTSEFGDCASREAKALLSIYKPLLEPLPLAGANVDPNSLRTSLNLTFPWMSDAVRAITDDISFMFYLGQPWVHIHPLLIVGPPGIGKTTLALQVANAIGTGFGMINAAGSADNRSLAGTARGWASTQPALPC